jgi:hypothetical protein
MANLPVSIGRQVSLIMGPHVVGAPSFFSASGGAAAGFSIMTGAPTWASADVTGDSQLPTPTRTSMVMRLTINPLTMINLHLTPNFFISFSPQPAKVSITGEI